MSSHAFHTTPVFCAPIFFSSIAFLLINDSINAITEDVIAFACLFTNLRNGREHPNVGSWTNNAAVEINSHP